MKRVTLLILFMYSGLLPFVPLKETHLEIFLPAIYLRYEIHLLCITKERTISFVLNNAEMYFIIIVNIKIFVFFFQEKRKKLNIKFFHEKIHLSNY